MIIPAAGMMSGRLQELIRRGRALRVMLDADRTRGTLAETRLWQRDCEAAIRELSGGSKAHWVSRAYSDALLVRTAAGMPEAADLATIVDRLLVVLDRAATALAEASPSTAALSASGGPAAPRFDFVHDAALRPLLEQAYADGRLAFERREYSEALTAFCGTLEATLTDALVHRHPEMRDDVGRWSFMDRIAAAQRAGLIRNGCARLPPTARSYRDEGSNLTVTETDARMAGQVLRTVIRDLDPGR